METNEQKIEKTDSCMKEKYCNSLLSHIYYRYLPLNTNYIYKTLEVDCAWGNKMVVLFLGDVIFRTWQRLNDWSRGKQWYQRWVNSGRWQRDHSGWWYPVPENLMRMLCTRYPSRWGWSVGDECWLLRYLTVWPVRCQDVGVLSDFDSPGSLLVRLLADNLGIGHQPSCAHCCHNIWLPQPFLRPVVLLFLDLETLASEIVP